MNAYQIYEIHIFDWNELLINQNSKWIIIIFKQTLSYLHHTQTHIPKCPPPTNQLSAQPTNLVLLNSSHFCELLLACSETFRTNEPIGSSYCSSPYCKNT